MNELDVYYRALLGYKKQTAESNKCTALRSAIASSSVDGDRITVKTASCTIEEDWVNNIEEGLIHIEKAIKMERQFIRSNGEVIPIEKVKHVSKESVEHLAKHSSLITRYEEGEDIVPDKLYTVERLNDYAVYENRFLYMLLCYLRDFVTIRYNEILDLTNKYDATICFDKKIINGKQNMSYTLSMHDVRRDDDYLKQRNPSRDIIDRIDLILKTILAFLATPLMEEVGKAPMIKPPITKTNVLKMNNSFKGAVALYEYIVAYDKKGYNIEIDERVISPFRDELANDIAEAGGMLSFIVYQNGLGLKQELKEAYQREEDRRNEEQIKQRADRIAAMKRRLKNSEVSIEDYVLTLEKQIRALESESERASALAKDNDKLRAQEREHLFTIDKLNESIGELNKVIIDEKQRHFEEIEALKQAHEDAMHSLVVEHESEIERLNEAHEKYIDELNAQHEEKIALLNGEIENIKEGCRIQIEEARENADRKISSMRDEYTHQFNELSGTLADVSARFTDSQNKYAQLLEEKRLSDARVKAVCGVDYDLTDRNSFNELEKEYNAFRTLYKEQWAKTKRQIRKNHLNIENIKGQNNQDGETD